MSFILCLVAAKLKGSGSGIEELVEAIRVSFQEEVIDLKIILKVSRVRPQDKLEVAVSWGVFLSDPNVKKIIARAKRTLDNFSDQLFTFEVPPFDSPDEEPEVALRIAQAMVGALRHQLSFWRLESGWIKDKVEKFDKVESLKKSAEKEK